MEQAANRDNKSIVFSFMIGTVGITTAFAANGIKSANLSNKNAFNIAESGSFQVENNQVLSLEITSNIKGGTVGLVLFDPSGKEQRITIGSANTTKEIPLSKGILNDSDAQ